MNNFLKFILTSSFLAVTYFNAQLDITGRLDRGTLEGDVRRVQTVTVLGKSTTDESAVKASMDHLRGFATCVKTPANCKSSLVRRK